MEYSYNDIFSRAHMIIARNLKSFFETKRDVGMVQLVTKMVLSYAAAVNLSPPYIII